MAIRTGGVISAALNAITAIEGPAVIARIIAHLGLPYTHLCRRDPDRYAKDPRLESFDELDAVK